MNATVAKFLAFGIGPVLSAGINLITIPILTWLLLPEELAKSVLAITTLGLVSLLCMGGLDQAFVRDFYESDDVDKLVFHTMGVNLGFCCFFILFSAISWGVVSVYIFDSVDRMAGCIMAIHLFVMIVNRYYFLALRMDERAGLYSFLTVLQSVFNLLIISVLYFLFEIKGFKMVLFSAMFAQFLISLLLVFNVRIITFRLLAFDKNDFKPLFDYSWPILISTIFMWVLYSSDQWMVRALSGFEELGVYSVAYKIASAGLVLQALITVYWVPLSLRWYKDGVSIKNFSVLAEIFCAIFLLLFLVLVAGRSLLSFVLSSEYYVAVEVFPFILMYPLMYALSEILSVGIIFTKKNKLLVVITAMCAAVNIALNYILIPKLGALGAGYSTALSFVLYLVLRTALSFFLWKRFDINLISIMVFCLIFVLFLLRTPYEGLSQFALLVMLALVILFNYKRWRSILNASVVGDKVVECK